MPGLLSPNRHNHGLSSVLSKTLILTWRLAEPKALRVAVSSWTRWRRSTVQNIVVSQLCSRGSGKSVENGPYILLSSEVRMASWEYLCYGPKQRLHIFKFIGVNLRSLRCWWDVCFWLHKRKAHHYLPNSGLEALLWCGESCMIPNNCTCLKLQYWSWASGWLLTWKWILL